MYLVRRSNGWYFQRRVPHYFSKVFGLSVLRRKLGPMPKREAQRMATALAGHLETRFAAMSNLRADEIDFDAFIRDGSVPASTGRTLVSKYVAERDKPLFAGTPLAVPTEATP